MKDFFDFNKVCPVCNNKLTLYFHYENYLDNKLFIFSNKDNDILNFIPDEIGIKQLSMFNSTSNEEEYFSILCHNNKIEIISDANIFIENKNVKTSAYFYYLCDRKAIHFENNFYNYEIDVYKSCYYRSSPYLTFKKSNSNFEYTNNLLNRKEVFTIKYDHKVYILAMDYEIKETILWYYHDNINDDNDVELFEKKLSLCTLPSFDKENRAKLIEKLNTWILLS